MFRASSAHLQEDTVVHMQHMVLSLSMRVCGGLSVHSLCENWLSQSVLQYNNICGWFKKFCTLYFFSLKMNLFYKIHLQAFNVISIVLYQSSPTFWQILYSCQDAFVVDRSDYLGHLIRYVLFSSWENLTFSDRTLLHGCGHPVTLHKCIAGNGLPDSGRICSFTEQCVVETELTLDTRATLWSVSLQYLYWGKYVSQHYTLLY